MSSRRVLAPLRKRRATGLAVVAITAALLAQMGASPASAAPTLDGEQLSSDAALTAEQKKALVDSVVAQPAGEEAPPTAHDLGLTGPTAFLIELDTKSTASTYNTSLASGSEASADADAQSARTKIKEKQQAVRDALPGVVPDASVLYETETVTAGLSVVTDAANEAKLYSLPGVAAVYPIAPKKLDNAGAAALVGSPQVWQAHGQLGDGVSVGILDTGIDYTHSDFGGPGSVEVFDAVPDAGPVPDGLFPNDKVVGGHDFVGDSYNADPSSETYQPIPHPDDNPLDCNGHGSHVAGSAAGLGVNADGTTYAGPYDESTPLQDMKIGPGMAPAADLYALRVFGCDGSTNVVAAAVEWALDPNGDGSPADHLDVINLSLGSDFGVPDDGDSVAVTKAMEAGMLVVASAGNAGNVTDTGGSPGAATKVLTVAASVDANDVFDAYTLTPEVAGVPTPAPGLYSVLFDYIHNPDFTGELALPVEGDDPTGCAPLAGDYTGKTLVIDAAGFACGSIAKANNAVAANAAGLVIVSDDDTLAVGINGSAAIPAVLTKATEGAAIKTALADGQAISINFGFSLMGTSKNVDPAQVDQIASFSSRGKHGAGNLKPDVSAPGQSIYSVQVGGGSAGANNSGTSMAAPVTTGVAALVIGANPEWTPGEVKADIMNTATHDLWTEPGQTGLAHPPARTGAGRIDAAQAVDNQVLAYVQEDAGAVSVSFGPVEVTGPTTKSKTIRIVNKGTEAATYSVAYTASNALPGVSFSVNKSSVTVEPGATANVVVSLNVTNPAALRKVIDPTMVDDGLRQFLADASGRVVLTPTSGGTSELRVPVYAAPRPAATLAATVSGVDTAAATLNLAGAGVANGPVGQSDSFYSLVSAFEQVGSSGKLPVCSRTVKKNCVHFPSERAADLRAVGVTTTVPQEADPTQGALYFAVAAQGAAAAPLTVFDYNIAIDTDGDPKTIEAVVRTARLPDGADLSDIFITYVEDADGNLLPSNDNPAISLINDLPGSIDTQAFDTDVVVIPVPLSIFPSISEANPRINFGVFGRSAYGMVDTLGVKVQPDGTLKLDKPLTYNAYAPGLLPTTGLGTAAVNVPVAGPASIPVTVNPAEYAADGAQGLLTVIYQNSSTVGKAQSTAVTVPSP